MRPAHKTLWFENWNLLKNNGTRNTNTFPSFFFSFSCPNIHNLFQRVVASHPIHPRNEVGATKPNATCSITFL